MRLLFAAAEAFPLAKVGGLADVVGSLPRALAHRGHDVRLILPRYRMMERYPAQPQDHFTLEALGRQQEVTLKLARVDSLEVYLVENGYYFDRPGIYGERDDLERFFFFCRATLEALKRLPWQAEVVHCHDWHAALLPLWLRRTSLACVLTIHNLAHQGPFDGSFAALSGLDKEMGKFVPGSFLSLGILHADMVTTVSPTYAREILNPEQGMGLDSRLKFREQDLTGIVNGIDEQEFNPATDPSLPVRYDVQTLDNKKLCKQALQQRVGLPASETPLLGMVSRLDAQKGIDLLAAALGPLLERGEIQLVILGKGLPNYEEMVRQLVQRYPNRVAAFIAFDNPLAHLIYAGSDLFLMPSRFEPCGLGQMIALRYGTIPIVRRTGGLADTVRELSPTLEEGNGFVFGSYEPGGLQEAVRRAVAAFPQREDWRRLQQRVMALDFSWDAAVAQYEAVYKRALEKSQRRQAKLSP